MTKSFKNIITSGQVQLNVIGVFLMGLLGIAAWNVARPLTWFSVVPLLLLGYAAFRVVFELTFNRANVPTLATTFVGRGIITNILRQDAALRGNKPYTVIDLGSGRGELTRRIAKAIPNARVIGIEMSRIPFWQSAFVQRWLGPKNLYYQCCDFWPFDCSEIDAVVFYLTPRIAQRVGEKLDRELRPGSMVISYTFPLLGVWTPVEVIRFRAPFQETIYVYRKA